MNTRVCVFLLLAAVLVHASGISQLQVVEEGMGLGPEVESEEIAFTLSSDQKTRIASAVKLRDSAVIPCPLCVSAVGFVQNVALHEGCGLLFSSAALAACEAIGLGPQDPLSELCTAALIGGCVTIANDLSSGIVNTTQICVDLTFC
jgi:hypothetical protein